MEIRKDYKFYAAHRNQDLADKCANIHGHVYRVSFFFDVQRQGSISTLFSDFDDKIEPHLKQNYDHGMLIDQNDGLFDLLCSEPASSCMRFKKMNGPTSVENLCFYLFSEVTEMGFDIQRIEVKETDSSTIIYYKKDYLQDSSILTNNGILK